jgi:hypothetical protein
MSTNDLEEVAKEMKKVSFLNHVFRFDEESKNEMINIIQYAFIAVVPVVLLNKFIKHYIPEVDDTKGNVEIGFEIAAQIIILFMGLFFVHRIITFVPTYSGEDYKDFSLVGIIMFALVIILSLQTKIGEKTNILVERIMNVWEGNTTMAQSGTSSKNSVSKTQPISNTQTLSTTPVTMLPQQQNIAMNNPQLASIGQTSNPTVNALYPSHDANPLIGAQAPGGAQCGFPNMMDSGVMAANDALGGGSSFGSMF